MMKQKTKKSTKQHQVNCENPHCGFTFHITAPVQVPIYMLQLCTVLMWRRCVQQVLFPPWYSCIGTIQTNKWFLFKICRRHLFWQRLCQTWGQTDWIWSESQNGFSILMIWNQSKHLKGNLGPSHISNVRFNTKWFQWDFNGERCWN